MSKKLFAQTIFDLGAGLVNLLDSAYRFVFAFEAQEGAENINAYDLKAIYTAQGSDQATASYLQVDSYADMFILSGSGTVKLIDKSLLKPGGFLSLLITTPGIVIAHDFDKTTIPVPDRPANYDDLVPIRTSTGADYTTTSGNGEPFDFRLIYDGADYWFHDWTRASSSGSVTPDFYISEKKQQQGVTVTSGSSLVLGFATNELTGASIGAGGGAAEVQYYGTAKFAVNAGGNGLTCTQSGVLTSLSVDTIGGAGLYEIDFATGLAFGIGTDGNIYPVEGAGAVGYSDNALFLQHQNGATKTAAGKFILGQIIEIL